jgi:hypothetical protein
MGIWWDCERYLGGFIEQLNVRFAALPTVQQVMGLSEEDRYGGIEELAAVQKEFKIFEKDVPFGKSANVLGMGGAENMRCKNRWIRLLSTLDRFGAIVDGETVKRNGNDAVVAAVIEALGANPPVPVYFKTHDYGDQDAGAVLIDHNAQPAFYLQGTGTYTTISLPIQSRLSYLRKNPSAKAKPPETRKPGDKPNKKPR